ncbi:hypothetical protein [Flavobacterium sp.]|jgi:hypothetical protein|uniref:hypothetical protein n=1 Tax=Flavobacterium sp. TaxID=239 RepID=UPI0037BE89C7
MEKTDSSISRKFNIALYSLFILLALYQSLYSKVYVDAASSLAIALIFDPFNPQQPWKERPKWQRIWLIIHLATAAALLGFGIGFNER